MMKRLISILSSFYVMGFLLLCFAASIGYATFIEKWYGTATARALIYNAWWFELMLFLGIINITGVILLHKLYRKEKFTIFLFHLSFIVILLGAAVTRFFGYEGEMRIREGASSNQISSSSSFLFAHAIVNGETLYDEESMIISPLKSNYRKLSFKDGKKDIHLECTKVIPNAVEIAQESPNGKPLLELVIAGHSGRETFPLQSGQTKRLDFTNISFNDSTNHNGVNIWMTDSGSFIKASFPIVSVSMTTQTHDTLKENIAHPFKMMSLYAIHNVRMVANKYYPSGEIDVITMPHAEKNQLPNALRLKVTVDNKAKNLIYFASENAVNQPLELTFEGVSFKIAYGAKPIELPFSLKLNKFIVEHHPGSNSPSSYESKITLIDSAKNINEEHRIYMNNVLKHRGYRFYQSSYDNDEKGTILSVNHDFWGTAITYFGYVIMGLGMAFSLFSKNSRFMKLSQELNVMKDRKKALSSILLLAFLSFAGISNVSAQEAVPDSFTVSAEHAAKFAKLMIQDPGGRIKPVNSLSSEMLRKISRKTSWGGLNSDQVILSMISFPQYWQNVPMIKFSHPEIGDLLNATGKHASFNNLFDTQNKSNYVLAEKVSEATRKKPALRSKFETELIRFDERANLCYLLYVGNFFRIFPKEGDKNNTWYAPENAASAFQGEELNFVKNVFPYYIESVVEATRSGKWGLADTLLQSMISFQQKFGKEIMPSEFKAKMEITYNKSDIFSRLGNLYGLVGFILLVLQFITLFNTRLNLQKVMNIARYIIIGGFILHFIGLVVRWYISGHAPLSNGYESMIYIAFATILAGIFFAKKSDLGLSTTALLAWIIQHVAHLSWMDPEITNLVPVLNSYWLLIHVTVIITSYGFLALGALLAFINLVLMFSQSEKNFERIGLSISEVTHVIEMTFIVGLYLLTIGTFLGGVWANESWGRYWGWDAKETWALVTILVYAFISHMRLIPGLKSKFLFNILALLSFSTVIMTYFGVNYYLSGLHSYAKGDSTPIPSFVYYTVTIIALVAIMAYINQYQLKRKKGEISA